MSRTMTIEDYLDDLHRHLEVEPRRARRILAEVEDHLRESARALERDGAAHPHAEAAAIERFGRAEEVARRFTTNPEANLLAPGSDPMAFLNPPAGRALLAIEHLTKVYRGGTVANDDISLCMEPGEVFGLLGPNGAGKTTLVSQVIGLLKPTSGSIRLGGIDLVADPDAARAFCSYLPQSEPPIASLKVAHAIQLVARIRGAGSRRARQRCDELLAALEIDPWRDKLGSALSGGVKRLAGFAMAAVQPGQLVILDEPTNNVDPLRRRLLWREVRRLADAGSTVLLVTHNVLEAEQAVDHLAIIDGGKVLASGTPSSLKQDARDVVRLVVSLDPLGSPPAEPPFARQVIRVGRRMILTLPEGDAPHAMRWARDLVEAGIAEEYQIGATTLEDTYVRLVGRADAAELIEEDSIDERAG